MKTVGYATVKGQRMVCPAERVGEPEDSLANASQSKRMEGAKDETEIFPKKQELEMGR